MNDTKRFVVGIDGSDESRSALRWAVVEASLWNAELDVVHAWDLPFTLIPPPLDFTYGVDVADIEKAAKALLDHEVAAATGGTVTVPRHIEKIVVRDTAAGALLETSKGADLLIVGSRGRGGFRGLLLGSVSNQCVHHAPCPVVVIRSEDSHHR